MPKLDITTLDKELRSGKLRPAYVIVGEESYLAQGAMRILREKVCGKAADDLSCRSFTAKESKVGEVIDSLRTVPFLSEKILVIIRDAEKMQKALLEALTSYLESPVDTSILMVVASKLDGRTKFMQLAGKTAAVVECKPLFANKIPFWINMEVKRGGKQISQQAANFLADMVGGNLGELAQAIERIILYVGKRKLVELSDIEHAIAETHQRTIFELTDAVGMRKLPKAISLLHNILENGGAPVLTLNMLARHFRILSKAKEISGRITGKGEIAKYLGVHPFYAMNYMDQSKNFSSGELRDGFRTLHRCDRSLKSSRIPKERILEKALFQIIRV